MRSLNRHPSRSTGNLSKTRYPTKSHRPHYRPRRSGADRLDPRISPRPLLLAPVLPLLLTQPHPSRRSEVAHPRSALRRSSQLSKRRRTVPRASGAGHPRSSSWSRPLLLLLQLPLPSLPKPRALGPMRPLHRHLPAHRLYPQRRPLRRLKQRVGLQPRLKQRPLKLLLPPLRINDRCTPFLIMDPPRPSLSYDWSLTVCIGHTRSFHVQPCG